MEEMEKTCFFMAQARTNMPLLAATGVDSREEKTEAKLLTYPVCNIRAAHPTITASDLITSVKHISAHTKSVMLQGVSILELAIITAMKHLTDIYEGEP
ncbi:hypothetical protein RRG08_063653 [Elysia crispata]|uniref:Origin recognition complex subunit 4 C-terminal domain-containing protein n=1 Tax=Elysia crispata TaxID=231223 RepID=A0AAE0Y8D3_9GAST|nr:hypothetical protein RRG08_063653 [Elysia crispata]